MTNYCLVIEGVIKDGPRGLPWEYNNMTAFNLVPDPTIYGWYPYTADDIPSYDPATQKIVEQLNIDDTAKTVTQTLTVVALTPQELADIAAQLSEMRDRITATMNNIEDLTRAFALVMLDEINLHASSITAILNAVDAANSLTELKSSIASIVDVPQRTITQVISAIRNKLGS